MLHEPGEQDASSRSSNTRVRFARSSCGWRCACTGPPPTAPNGARSAHLFADLVRERDELELLGEPELSCGGPPPHRHRGPLDEHNRALAAARRRPRLRLGRGHRRHRVPAAVLRQLPHQPRGRARAARRRARTGRGARVIICASRAPLVGCRHDDADARCRPAARAARGRAASEGRVVRMLLGDARSAAERRGAGRAGRRRARGRQRDHEPRQRPPPAGRPAEAQRLPVRAAGDRGRRVVRHLGAGRRGGRLGAHGRAARRLPRHWPGRSGGACSCCAPRPRRLRPLC